MAEESVYIRLVVRDGETARQVLERTGAAGSAALDRLGAAGRRATADTEKLSQAAASSGGSFGMMRGGLSNLSFQLQDVAVQASAGTNALQILIQQGPQISSVFGPVGAVMGVVIASAGALALAMGGLGSEADSAAAAAKAFDEAQKGANATAGAGATTIDELAASYRAMSQEARDLARIDLQQQLRANQAALEAQQTTVRESIEGFEDFRQLLENPLIGAGGANAPAEVQAQAQALREMFAIIDGYRANEDIAQTVIAINALGERSPAARQVLEELAGELVANANDAQALADTAARLTEQLEQLAAAGTRAATSSPGSGPRAEADAAVEAQKRAKESLEATRRVQRQVFEDREKERARDKAAAERAAAQAEALARQQADREQREAERRRAQRQAAEAAIAGEIRNQEELIAAYAEGADAVAAVTREQAARAKVLAAGLELESEAGQALYAQALAAEELTAQTKALADAEAERGRKAAQAQAERDRAAEAAKRQIERQAEEQARLMQEPFLEAARNIQDSIGSAIYDALDGSLKDVGDYADAFKQIMLRMIAEVSAAMVFRPIMGEVAGMATGGGGGFGGIGQGFGQLGQMIGGSSFGTAINGFGAATGLWSSGVASSTATVGALGAGQGAAGLSGLGMPGAATSMTGASGASAATLTGTLGVAALGYFGGQALASLTGGNATGGGIGGAIGAGIGHMILPGIGGFIGGALGGAVGGLFGNTEPSNREQGINLNLSTGLAATYGQTGKKYSAENAEAAQTIAEAAYGFAQQLAQTTGGRVGLGGFDLAIGDRDGVKLGLGSTQTTYGTTDEAISALTRAIVASLTGAGANVQTLIGNGKLDYSDPQSVEKALGLAAAIDQLANPVNETKQAVDALNKTYDDAIAQAKALDLSTKELSAARDRDMGLLRDGVQAQIDAFVGASDSGAALRLTLAGIDETFRQLIEAGEAVGADTSQLVEAQERQRAAARQAYAEQQRQAAREEAQRRAQIRAFIDGESASSGMRMELEALRLQWLDMRETMQALGEDTAELDRAFSRNSATIRQNHAAQAQAERDSFAVQRLQFLGVTDAGAALSATILGIRQGFAGLAETATKLGRDTTDLARAMREQLAAAQAAARLAASNFAAGYYAFLGAGGDENMRVAAQQQAIRAQYEQIVADAKRLGQNIDQGKLYQSMLAQAQAVRDASNEAIAAAAEARRQEEERKRQAQLQWQREQADLQQQINAALAEGDPAKELEVQIAAISRGFADLAAKAVEYKLSTAGLAQAERDRIAAAREAFAEAQRQAELQRQQETQTYEQRIAQFLALTDPAKALEVQIAGIRREFEELTEAGQRLKLDTTGLAEAMDAQIKAAREARAEAQRQAYEQARGALESAGGQARSFFSQLLDPIQGLLDQITGARPGGLASQWRRNDAEIARLFGAAQGGDVAAMQQLPDLISTALGQVRQLNASGATAQAAERRYEDILRTLQSSITAERDRTEALIPTVSKGFAEMAQTFRDELRKLTAAFERYAQAARVDPYRRAA